MNKDQSNERVAFSLFHAAVEREKEQETKQPAKQVDEQKEPNERD